MRDLDRILGDAADAGRHASTPLPAAQIRRVAGRVRRVRTATATTLTAAVVAGVVIVVTTAGVPNAAPDLTDTPTPTETITTPGQPPTTSPPSGSPQDGPILDGSLITADQLAQFYFGDPDIGWAESEPTLETRCQPGLSPEAIETAHVAFTPPSGGELQVEQWSEAYASDLEAATRLADIRAALGACAERDDEVELFEASTITGVGDGGFIADLYESIADFEDVSLYSTFRAAHTGRVVTWTQFAQVKTESLDASTVAELSLAIERICGPAGGACIGEPKLIRTYPNPDDTQAPGLITAEEVNSALSGNWRSDVIGAPAGDVPEFCSPESLVEAGATETLSRTFVDDDAQVPGVTSVQVTWGQLGSFESALPYTAQQLESWTDCTVDGIRPVRVISETSNLWRLDFGDHYAYYGFASDDSYVLVVQWNSTVIDDEAFYQLQGRARERFMDFVYGA